MDPRTATLTRFAGVQVGNSEVAYYMQQHSFNKPYWFTWCGNACLALLYPGCALYLRFSRSDKQIDESPSAANGSEHVPLLGSPINSSVGGVQAVPSMVQRLVAPPMGIWAYFASHGFRPTKVVLVSTVLAVLFTLSGYTWFIGLPLTSVSEATVVFNSNVAFTYLFR